MHRSSHQSGMACRAGFSAQYSVSHIFIYQPQMWTRRFSGLAKQRAHPLGAKMELIGMRRHRLRGRGRKQAHQDNAVKAKFSLHMLDPFAYRMPTGICILIIFSLSIQTSNLSNNALTFVGKSDTKIKRRVLDLVQHLHLAHRQSPCSVDS